MHFSSLLNLGGCLINVGLYLYGKNTLNLICAVFTGVVAIYFFCAGF